MAKTNKIKKAYNFFCIVEKENKNFSLVDVVNETGWALSTVEGYKSKKWSQFLIEDGDFFKCIGISNISLQTFIKLHGQRTEIFPEDYRPRFSETIDILIDKSLESALLAIQIYNNPTVKFKTEGYLVFMVIAFTKLFHAIFENKNINYWYTDIEGNKKLIDGETKYWELSECLKQYYKGLQTAEKENLVLCISIRNKIEHRFYETIDLNLSGYCQSLLMNYENLLVTEFGNYFSIGSGQLTLALQITSFNELDKAKNIIQQQNYSEIKKYLEDFCLQLPKEINESQRFQFRAFLIPKIGNHAKSSDIALEWVKYDPTKPEEMEEYNRMVGLIKEKRVPVANQGKFLPGKVVAILQERGLKTTISFHTKAWKYFKVRSSEKSPEECNTKYCQFDEAHENFIYTGEWIDFLEEKLKDENEIEKIKKFRN